MRRVKLQGVTLQKSDEMSKGLEHSIPTRTRNTVKVYAVALLCSGIAHAAIFSPAWWSSLGPDVERQSMAVALHVVAASDPSSAVATASEIIKQSSSDSLNESLPDTPARAAIEPGPTREPLPTQGQSAGALSEKSTAQAGAIPTDRAQSMPRSAPTPRVAQVPATAVQSVAVASPKSLTSVEAELRPQEAPLSEAHPPRAVEPPSFQMGTAQNPDPVYPGVAKRRGWQGEVLLRVEVGADGRSREVEVLSSSGYPVLDKSALKTIRDEWRFEPARRNDVPVLGYATVPVRFEFE